MEYGGSNRPIWAVLYNFSSKVALYNFESDITEIIKSMIVRLASLVACMEAMRNVQNILVRTTEGKEPFRRHKCRWQDCKRNGVGESGLYSFH
jgi:hypothetical protein